MSTGRRVFVQAALLAMLVGCGSPVEPSACERCPTQEQGAVVDCNADPLATECSGDGEDPNGPPIQDPNPPPPPPPPPTAAPGWPAAGQYSGTATITGTIGTTTAGCQPIGGKLGVSLWFGTTTVSAGNGAMTVVDGSAPEFVFTQTINDLGGAPGSETRSYSVAVSADGKSLTGTLEYARDTAAATRTGCSGYVFSVAYYYVPPQP